MTLFMVGAGDKGVEALDLVDQACRYQFIERPIDLDRRADAGIGYRFQKRIGALRPCGALKRIEHRFLVFRKHDVFGHPPILPQQSGPEETPREAAVPAA